MVLVPRPDHDFKSFTWTCPYCNHGASVQENRFSAKRHGFHLGNKDGHLDLNTTVIVCPNPDCLEYEITGELVETLGDKRVLMQWRMRPRSFAKPLPDYIPAAIRLDYGEACLIRDDSPKASATLSRRCLQGMIRDFWEVKKNRLADAINAIEEKVDPLTWKAIHAVRQMGNIGAHMEKDINLIIDVDPEEAQILIGLIEILFKDWYIARHERQKQLERVVRLSAQKAAEKKSGVEPEPESGDTG